MKNIYLLILIILGVNSCELPDNVDPKGASQVSADALFSNGLVALVDQVNSISVNLNITRLFAQYNAQITYIDEGNFNFTDRRIPDAYFDEFYRDVLMDLKEAKKILNAIQNPINPEVVTNQKAMVDILEVYAYQCLVDAFGNVPYSQALQSLENPSPVYDDAQTIYLDLLTRINADIEALDANYDGFGENDFLYSGDVSKWQTFANSLKLRIAMRIADVPALAASAQTEAESAIAAGVISTQSESAIFIYPGVSPYTNSIYEEMIEGGRLDYVPAVSIVKYMTGTRDPRMPHYFANPYAVFRYRINPVTGSKKDSTIAGNPAGEVRRLIYQNIDGDDSVVFKVTPFVVLASDSIHPFKEFVGGRPGDIANRYARLSHFSDAMFEATFPVALIDLAEVEFLLAEASARGFDGVDEAEVHYKNGIVASIKSWGGVASDTTGFISLPNVAYDAANWRRSIGLQKWVALYNRGIEGWAEIRRLDLDDWTVGPLVRPAASRLEANPSRMPYPYTEDDLNAANKAAAATAIGGDLPGTKIFWDVD